MKHLLGMLLVASLATTGFAQDPGTDFSNGTDNGYNDYTQSSAKSSQKKFDANADKDMNNTMDMNNPLYMENGRSGQPDKLNSDYNGYTNESSDVSVSGTERSKAGKALNNAGEKSKKGISKGWDKVKHNKLTKHLFNQPRNS